MNVRCASCGHDNAFEQPYPYHAGFSDQGFLYNDSGNLTLVWSSYDPAYVALVGHLHHPWSLSRDQWGRVEASLRPAADGTSWRANNPPKCLECHAAIGRPIASGEIYYLVYAGSPVIGEPPTSLGLAEVLRSDAPAT